MQKKQNISLYCDGASRGNPGDAAAGIHIIDTESKEVLYQKGIALGKKTNNEAEYESLIQGIQSVTELAKQEGYSVDRLNIFMDSELVCFQIQGKYKVKKENLKPLHAKAKDNLAHFENWSITPIPRKENSQADRMANLALDGK